MNFIRKPVNISIKTSESTISIAISTKGVPISKMNCIKQKNDTLFICDIKSFSGKKYINKGYGSMMMDKLLEYAVDNEIHTIYGNLSLVDKDHEERLHHFYEKYGFKIILFKEPNNLFYGKVIKIL